MSFELDGENPPGVLSEVETSSCAPLNQCDMKSCSDGISMITATALYMYQVDYNKLQLSHPILIYYLNFVVICGLGFMFFCIYYSHHSYEESNNYSLYFSFSVL